ncbi:MAG: tetratricopeptide repeat protein [Wenzhouxiangella sp.]
MRVHRELAHGKLDRKTIDRRVMSDHQERIVEIRQQLQAGELAQAREQLDAALAEYPDEADLAVLSVLCLEAEGEAAEARAEVGRLLEQFPQHAPTAYHAGRLALVDGQSEQAEEYLQIVLALDPNHAAARTLLARLKQRAGDQAGAIELLRTALRADGDHVPALVALSSLLLASKDVAEARELAARAVSLRPDDVPAQIAMAMAFKAEGHEEFARQCLQNALEKMPGEPRLEKAMAVIESAPAESAAGPSAVQQASAAMLRNDLATAERLLAQADPQAPASRLALGRLRLQQGRLGEAKASLESLLEHPEFEHQHDATRLMADCKLAEDDQAGALAVLLPLVDHPRLPLDTSLYFARLQHSNGLSKEAVERLDALLERHEGEAQARIHNMIARIADEAGDVEKAAGHIDSGQYRSPFLVNELNAISPPGLQRAWLEIQDWPFNDVADGALPVLIAGWPGSGREMLVSALTGSDALAMMPANELGRRRQLFNLPSWPERVLGLDSAMARRQARRYRQNMPSDRPLLDTGWYEPVALPALCRALPGLTVINPVAREEYLRLQWRLSGCRDIGRMLEAWQAEQSLFEHLRGLLPIRVIDVELKDLLSDPKAALEPVASALAIPLTESMVDRLESIKSQLGQRSPDHWRAYQVAG